MKQLILLNGPGGCGKTDAVASIIDALTDRYGDMTPAIEERQCKDKLHTLTMEFFNVTSSRYWTIYNTRELKERPQPEFTVTPQAYNALMRFLYPGDGSKLSKTNEKKLLSIRQAMIYVSEVLCKPSFGMDYFGLARLHSISDNAIAIDDSTGFEEELHPAIDTLGQENLLLIRIHGRGDFANDSRNYINDGVITNTHDVYNGVDSKQGLADFLATTTALVTEFTDARREISASLIKARA